MRRLKIIATVTACIALAACASIAEDTSTLYLDLTCNPQGATLYQENLNLGTCPKTVQYKISDQDKARGSMTLKGITAFWVSGVSSSIGTISANLQNGLHQKFHFERSRDAPNYNIDANYALELEKNRLLSAQVDAIKNQNIAIAVDQSASAPALRTHCTTNNIGQTAYTNCY